LTTHEIVFPDYFDARAGEIEAKGDFADVPIGSGGHVYRPEFIDPIRRAQEIRERTKPSSGLLRAKPGRYLCHYRGEH